MSSDSTVTTSLYPSPPESFFFFLNDPPPPEIYPLPLHDALPIYGDPRAQPLQREEGGVPPPAADHVSAGGRQAHPSEARQHRPREQDRRPDPGVDPARGADAGALRTGELAAPRRRRDRPPAGGHPLPRAGAAGRGDHRRSEERRVGEEGRSRGAADHLKKKR